ncbi:MAG: MBL fold metallo-hydrolase [Candidatus Omnitrophota bacterium]
MSKIRITMLGTTAGVPTVERGHTAIHVGYGDEKTFNCLFDCGEGTQRQMMKAGLNIMKIKSVFITHWHGDHCLGLPGLVDTMGFEGRKESLDIYAPEVSRLRRCLGFSYSFGDFRVKAHNVPAKGKKPATLLDAGRFRIVSIPGKHNIPSVSYAFMEKDKAGIDREKAAALGLPEQGEIYKEIKEKGEIAFGGRRIVLGDISVVKKGKKVVYSGDTEICDNLRILAKDADLLIQDCTYFDNCAGEKIYGHSSLPEIVKMVEESGVKKTVLTHVSRRYQDSGQLRALVEKHKNMTLAEDFLTVEV